MLGLSVSACQSMNQSINLPIPGEFAAPLTHGISICLLVPVFSLRLTRISKHSRVLETILFWLS